MGLCRRGMASRLNADQVKECNCKSAPLAGGAALPWVVFCVTHSLLSGRRPLALQRFLRELPGGSRPMLAWRDCPVAEVIVFAFETHCSLIANSNLKGRDAKTHGSSWLPGEPSSQRSH